MIDLFVLVDIQPLEKMLKSVESESNHHKKVIQEWADLMICIILLGENVGVGEWHEIFHEVSIIHFFLFFDSVDFGQLDIILAVQIDFFGLQMVNKPRHRNTLSPR